MVEPRVLLQQTERFVLRARSVEVCGHLDVFQIEIANGYCRSSHRYHFYLNISLIAVEFPWRSAVVTSDQTHFAPRDATRIASTRGLDCRSGCHGSVDFGQD